MQQYADKYMKQYSGKGSNTTNLQSLNSQSPADCTTWQCLCDLKMGQTHQFKVMIPAPYSDNAIESREKEYKQQLDAFAAKANVTLAELGLSKECRPKGGPKQEDVPAVAEACKTVAQLKAWHKHSLDALKFVPEDFRHFAEENAEKTFKQNLERLQGQDGAASASEAAESEPAAAQSEPAAAQSEPATAVSVAPTEASGSSPPKKKWHWPLELAAQASPEVLAAQAAPEAETHAAAPEAEARPAAATTAETLAAEAPKAESRAAEAPKADSHAAAAPATETLAAVAPEASSGPSGGLVVLCVLAGLSLPALTGLIGALRPRRCNAKTVEVEGSPELYEALV
jgi:hypothetical protein